MNEGEDSVCTATPDAGYEVSAWGGDCTGTPAASTTCTLANVQGPRTATVQFARITYPVTATPGANGGLTCTPNPVNEGEDSVCTATPDAGYEVSAWGGDCTGTPAASLTCTLVNVQSPKTVNVQFARITYPLTATPGANGGLTCTPNPVNHGEDSVCTATPDAGYEVSAWGGDCAGTDATSTTCTLANVQGPQTVSAHFVRAVDTVPRHIPALDRSMQALLALLAAGLGWAALRARGR